MPALTPGKYTLNDISLFSEVTGFRVPLTSVTQVLEFNLYENIFSESISGNIVVVDTNNLIANMPIIGNEQLQILLFTETNIEQNEDKLFITLRVYSIDNYKKENIGTSAYIISFASDEYIKNHSTKNSKITEYDSISVSSKFPLLMATMEKWNICVQSLSNDDLIKLQDRLTQLSNNVRREVSKRL